LGGGLGEPPFLKLLPTGVLKNYAPIETRISKIASKLEWWKYIRGKEQII
jgi:hypothetical protein